MIGCSHDIADTGVEPYLSTLTIRRPLMTISDLRLPRVERFKVTDFNRFAGHSPRIGTAPATRTPARNTTQPWAWSRLHAGSCFQRGLQKAAEIPGEASDQSTRAYKWRGEDVTASCQVAQQMRVWSQCLRLTRKTPHFRASERRPFADAESSTRPYIYEPC